MFDKSDCLPSLIKLSIENWINDDSYLIRFHNLNDLENNFVAFSYDDERTLTGNQNLKEMMKKKIHWKAESK